MHDGAADSRLPPVHLVHRLDRFTSGCMVVALNRRAASGMAELFKNKLPPVSVLKTNSVRERLIDAYNMRPPVVQRYQRKLRAVRGPLADADCDETDAANGGDSRHDANTAAKMRAKGAKILRAQVRKGVQGLNASRLGKEYQDAMRRHRERGRIRPFVRKEYWVLAHGAPRDLPKRGLVKAPMMLDNVSQDRMRLVPSTLYRKDKKGQTLFPSKHELRQIGAVSATTRYRRVGRIREGIDGVGGAAPAEMRGSKRQPHQREHHSRGSEGATSAASVVGRTQLGSLSWLAVEPETGRKHQIRVHLSDALGLPIVGDWKYGPKGLRRMYNGREFNKERPRHEMRLKRKARAREAKYVDELNKQSPYGRLQQGVAIDDLVERSPHGASEPRVDRGMLGPRSRLRLRDLGIVQQYAASATRIAALGGEQLDADVMNALPKRTARHVKRIFRALSDAERKLLRPNDGMPMFLFARSIDFVHPITGAEMQVTAPLPAHFEATMLALGWSEKDGEEA